MATLSIAVAMARTLLNDDVGNKWPDALLIPKAQVAHRQLQSELALSSIPVTKEQTTTLTVTAGAVNLGLSQPTDMIEPIELKERDVGASDDSWVPMSEVQFLPSIVKDTTLVYWAWYAQKVNFVGATTNRQVFLRYLKTLTVPTAMGDDLGFPMAENFIGPQIAYIATGDVRFGDAAQTALSNLIRTHVKGMQGMPRRRLPYRFRGLRRVG